MQIDFFKDRLEIHSPGNLYGRMTVAQLGVARPDLCNPALAVMAESLTGAENRYSGIPTIRKEMADAGLPDPVFENRRNEFVVTLYNGTVIYRSVPSKPSVVMESALYAVNGPDTEEVPGEKSVQDLLKFCAPISLTESWENYTIALLSAWGFLI